MEKDCFLVVNSKVLPAVYKNVLRAKTLLSEGKAPNASQAVKAVGISRSAFYKYKDYVFEYQTDSKNEMIHLNAILNDRAGVFSAMTATLYKYSARMAEYPADPAIPKNSVHVPDAHYGMDPALKAIPSPHLME